MHGNRYDTYKHEVPKKYEHVRFQFSDYESYVGSCKAKKAIRYNKGEYIKNIKILLIISEAFDIT